METAAIPGMRERILPLILIGWIVSAIRLALDFMMPDSPFTMAFGVYYLLPLVIAYIGLTRRWGRISWGRMAISMVLVGFLVWGIWNSIAYTTGQFMEWGHGRFHAGCPLLNGDGSLKLGADGLPMERDGRASAVQETFLAKLGAGLLHGLLSSLTGSIWCIGFGSVFIWVPTKLGARHQVSQP